MSRLMTALFVALTVVAAFAPRTASACSCTNNLTLQEEFGYAAAVFSGRVLSVVPAGDGFNVIVSMEPIARWKGGLGSAVIVVTPDNEGSCGFTFAVGVEYLVFASQPNFQGSPTYFTHLCARTSPLEDNPHVPFLGPPLQPTGALSPTWGGIKTIYR